MENQGLFKTALGGFEKKAVLSYIEWLNSQSSKMQTTMDELQSTVMDLTLKSQEISSKKDAVERALEEKRNENENLASKLQNTEHQLEDLKRKLEANTRELTESKKKFTNMTSGISELQEENAKYRATTSQIGSVLLDARQKGDQIIEDAKKDCAELVTQAYNNVSLANSKIMEIKMDLNTVRRDVGNIMESFKDKFDFIEHRLEASMIKDVSIPIVYDPPLLASKFDHVTVAEGKAPETITVKFKKEPEPAYDANGVPIITVMFEE